MLDLAQRNVEKAGVTNASFVEAYITSIPLPDSSADCIISNCVINLVPQVDKPLVFREMFRLLKPAGRVVFSDILTKKALSEEMKESVALYVGCVAGASGVDEYQKFLEDAGFQGEVIVTTLSEIFWAGHADVF
jgi:arsenite methyltransferase